MGIMSKYKPKLIKSKQNKNVIHDKRNGHTYKLSREGFMDITNNDHTIKPNGKPKTVSRIEQITNNGNITVTVVKDISDKVIIPKPKNTQIISIVCKTVDYVNGDFVILHRFVPKAKIWFINPVKKEKREYKPRTKANNYVSGVIKMPDGDYENFVEQRAEMNINKTVNGERVFIDCIEHVKPKSQIVNGAICEIKPTCLNPVVPILPSEYWYYKAFDNWRNYNISKYGKHHVLSDNWTKPQSIELNNNNTDIKPEMLYNRRIDILGY